MKMASKSVLSVIRQKGESQNGCFKKTKHTKFSENWTFLTPWYAHVKFIIIDAGDFTKTKKEKISRVGKINILFAETTKMRWVMVFPDWKNDAVSTLFTKYSVTVKIMRN